MCRPLLSVVLAGLAAVSLAGCAGTRSAAGPTLATDDSLTYNSQGDYAGVLGLLRTERNGTSLCVFVDSTAGLGKGRVNLVFPAGYSAVDDRAIRDTEDTGVAERGDLVAVSVMPELSGEMPAGCSSEGIGTARALHVDQEK